MSVESGQAPFSTGPTRPMLLTASCPIELSNPNDCSRAAVEPEMKPLIAADEPTVKSNWAKKSASAFNGVPPGGCRRGLCRVGGPCARLYLVYRWSTPGR